MAEVVLDASAVLALLNAEPGADEVAAALPGAAISAVNLAEVVGKLEEVGVPASDARRALAGLALDVVPFDETLAYRAGALRTATRGSGLSLGDRACLALAGHLGVPALTTDRAWRALDAGVVVRVVSGRGR